MLLKWLFNILIMLWVYHSFVRPMLERHFSPPPKRRPPPAEPPPSNHPQKREDDGEYIDYEEVK